MMKSVRRNSPGGPHDDKVRRLCSRTKSAVPLGLALIVTPIPEAQAHLVTTGLGPFYDGLAHVWFAPEDAISVLAIALLSGMSGKSTGRAALLTLPMAWCAGALLGLHAEVTPIASWVTVATFVGLGGLIASNCRLSVSAAVCLSIVLGLAHGYFSGSGMVTTASGPTMLAGMLASIFASIAIVAAGVVSLRPPWTRVAVRTLGSWIAAIGLLLLGWGLKGGLS
jgi:urease accessory protein